MRILNALKVLAMVAYLLAWRDGAPNPMVTILAGGLIFGLAFLGEDLRRRRGGPLRDRKIRVSEATASQLSTPWTARGLRDGRLSVHGIDTN